MAFSTHATPVSEVGGVQAYDSAHSQGGQAASGKGEEQPNRSKQPAAHPVVGTQPNGHGAGAGGRRIPIGQRTQGR